MKGQGKLYGPWFQFQCSFHPSVNSDCFQCSSKVLMVKIFKKRLCVDFISLNPLLQVDSGCLEWRLRAMDISAHIQKNVLMYTGLINLYTLKHSSTNFAIVVLQNFYRNFGKSVRITLATYWSEMHQILLPHYTLFLATNLLPTDLTQN